MTIDVRWFDDNKRIILCSFRDAWTWYDCREAVQKILYLQDSAGYRLNYIYDFTGSRLSARKTVRNLHRLLRLQLSPEPRQIIMVERRLRIHVMMDVVSQLYSGWFPANLYFADTIDGACELLQERLRIA